MDSILYSGISKKQSTEYLFERSALNDLIKTALEKPVTTVIAGTGYGKTQAVSTALDGFTSNPVWLQLSELDNFTARFWEHLGYAFKAYSEDFSNGLKQISFPEADSLFHSFLQLLAKALENKERLFLVFDDLQFIHKEKILVFIEKLINSNIQNTSIVIISRIKPKLNLTKQLQTGLLARITEENLRFSIEETEKYFNGQDIYPEKNVLANIYTYTDGWILAIYLIGLSAKKGDFNSRNPILPVKVDIFDLIEKEILSRISDKARELLIKISVLDFIPAGLLKELAEYNISLLNEFSQINLIRFDSFYDRYRIHSLLRDFLKERISSIPAEEINDVYMLAAIWCEKNNYPIEAVNNYKKCKKYDKIFEIILSLDKHITFELADAIIKLIDETPDEIIAENPVVKVIKSFYLFNNNQIDNAWQMLTLMLDEYKSLKKTKENNEITGEIYTVMALISLVRQDYMYEDFFRQAYKYLPYGSRLIRPNFNIADGLNICSIREPAKGELKRHKEALFNIAPYASHVMNGCGYGMEYLNAAESAFYTADLNSAEKYAYEAIYRSRKYSGTDIEFMANFVLIRIYTAKGNYTGIKRILEKLSERLKQVNFSGCATLYNIIEGWFLIKTGETGKVSEWIKDENKAGKFLAPIILGREYLVRSEYMLANGKYNELMAFMKQTDAIYEERGILYATIQNKITKAIILHYTGHTQESSDIMCEAYELSSPNNLDMQYIEYGSKMRTLINSVKQNENCDIPNEWLNRIYTKSSTYAKQLSYVIAEYRTDNITDKSEQIKLSKTELEVLTGLSRGLTRNEIASNCFLSANYVKNIIKSIYNKLGAYNRSDAVRIASEKGIIQK